MKLDAQLYRAWKYKWFFLLAVSVGLLVIGIYRGVQVARANITLSNIHEREKAGDREEHADRIMIQRELQRIREEVRKLRESTQQPK